MGRITFTSGKAIGNGNGPYFVAEMNSSHSGNIETARKMIDAAVRCGCDAAKFQSWSAETLYSAEYYRDNPIAKRMVERFSMREENLEELAYYCRGRGLHLPQRRIHSRRLIFWRGWKLTILKLHPWNWTICHF